MQFTTELQRLLFGTIIALGVVGLAAGYYAIVGPLTLLEREDNLRLLEAQGEVARGDVYDRADRLLVTSVEADNSTQQIRRFRHPSFNSALGYFSLTYGVAGVEAAYDGQLSGADIQTDDLNTYIEQEIFHRTPQGTDLQLTFDLEVQRALVTALEANGCFADPALTESGCAGVVLSVPDGGVLGMVSYPTYDPNQLDAQWEDLIDAPSTPFFNRALQGQYQPGGVFKTVMLTVAVINQYTADDRFENAADVVRVGEVAQVCTASPPSDVLTLRETYQYGCPAPFAQIVEKIGIQRVEPVYNLFSFDEQVTLSGFVTIPLDPDAEITPQPTPEATPDPTTDDLTLADIMGQGDITVSPLHMATVTTAMINGGNAPRPYTLIATRPPDANTWARANRMTQPLPITTQETSARLQNLMRNAVETGIAQGAARDGYDIGGHVGLAFTGQTTQVWFIGWVRTAAREGAVIAVLLEDTDDLDRAAAIGGDVLATAADAITSTGDN